MPTQKQEKKIKRASIKAVSKLYQSPDQFILDTMKLASDIQAYTIKYGPLGLKVVSDALTL